VGPVAGLEAVEMTTILHFREVQPVSIPTFSVVLSRAGKRSGMVQRTYTGPIGSVI
jgi:hypothetical protein